MSADSAGKLTVTMDSVDQHAMGIPCGDVELKGDAFTQTALPLAASVEQSAKMVSRSMAPEANTVIMCRSSFARERRADGLQAGDMASDSSGAIDVKGATLRLVLRVVRREA
jgi:hypothetical protein